MNNIIFHSVLFKYMNSYYIYLLFCSVEEFLITQLGPPIILKLVHI